MVQYSSHSAVNLVGAYWKVKDGATYTMYATSYVYATCDQHR